MLNDTFTNPQNYTLTVSKNFTLSDTSTTSITDPLENSFESIVQRLEVIEQRLNILVPNPELEELWQELAQARKHYECLEQQFLEKQKVWDQLRQAKPTSPKGNR